MSKYSGVKHPKRTLGGKEKGVCRAGRDVGDEVLPMEHRLTCKGFDIEVEREHRLRSQGNHQ